MFVFVSYEKNTKLRSGEQTVRSDSGSGGGFVSASCPQEVDRTSRHSSLSGVCNCDACVCVCGLSRRKSSALVPLTEGDPDGEDKDAAMLPLSWRKP